MKLGPKAELVYLQIKQQIDKGFYRPSTRLPSEKELLVQYDVGRNTVRAALKKLINDEMVESVQGAGVYVKSSIAEGKMVSFMYHGDIRTIIMVQNLLLENGCLMSLFSQLSEGWGAKIEAEFMQRVLIQRHFGLIASCTPSHPWNEELLKKLDKVGTRIIHVEPYRSDTLPTQNFIMPDYYDAGRLAAENLIKRGCNNIIFISAASSEPYVALMGNGYSDAVKRFGQKPKFICAKDSNPVQIKYLLNKFKGKIGLIVIPFIYASELIKCVESNNIISILLAGDPEIKGISVAVFDRNAILKRAIDILFAPGATIRELVPAKLLNF